MARGIHTDKARLDFSAPLGNFQRITRVKLVQISAASERHGMKTLCAPSYIYSGNNY
jgi:hypothetical protein